MFWQFSGEPIESENDLFIKTRKPPSKYDLIYWGLVILTPIIYYNMSIVLEEKYCFILIYL